MTGQGARAASWIEEVSADNAMSATAEIAQWVRLSGTEDERKAFDYINQQLRQFGLNTRIHEPTCLVSLPVSATLEVGGETFPCITHSFSVNTGEAGVAGELVDAGAGTAAELAGSEAAGKIALTDGLGTPNKAFAASAEGVRALINISGDRIHEMIVSPVWGSPTTDTLSLLPTVPVISVDTCSGTRLREIMANGPTRARVVTTVDTRWRPIPVLVADLDVGDRDYVLFSGHVDSWHYGAMDNGTANATMMEVARILADHRDGLRRGVRFAFWSGHSHARYAGSTWFADRYWFDLRDRCIAHVNVDSTGGIGASDLTGAFTMAETYGLAREVIQRQTGQELTYTRFGRAGDQSFWGVGLPAMFMSLSQQGNVSELANDQARLFGGSNARRGGLGWWWHTTEDLMDKISPENLERDIRIYVEVVGRLATDPVPSLSVSAAIQEIKDTLSEVQPLWEGLPKGTTDDAISFDELHHDLDEALNRARRLEERASSAGISDDDAQVITGRLVGASKALIPLNYTLHGEFSHDLAMGATPLPGLRPPGVLAGMSDDELWAASHGLRRALNRARYHVRSAAAELDR